MKIGIIVHSVTGNTLSVAGKLKERLLAKNHEAAIEEIKTDKKIEPGQKTANFTNLPDLEGYDVIIFGSHTEAFQLEQAMKLYFKQMERLNGQKVVCFVTHHFPKKWMGGKNAVNTMKTLCVEKGCEVLGTSVIDWSPEKKRSDNIERELQYMMGML